MEKVNEKTTQQGNTTEVVTLYRLGDGILATIETKRENAVSSFETKHFCITKQYDTPLKTLRRAMKEYKFDNIPPLPKKPRAKKSKSVK